MARLVRGRRIAARETRSRLKRALSMTALGRSAPSALFFLAHLPVLAPRRHSALLWRPKLLVVGHVRAEYHDDVSFASVRAVVSDDVREAKRVSDRLGLGAVAIAYVDDTG